MIIECVSCGKVYWLDREKIRFPGVIKVKCSNCNAIFSVDSKKAEEGSMFDIVEDVNEKKEEIDLEFGGKNPFDEFDESDTEMGEEHLNSLLEGKETFDSEKIVNLIQEEFSSLDGSAKVVDKEENKLEEKNKNVSADDDFVVSKTIEKTESKKPPNIEIVEKKDAPDDQARPFFSNVSQIEVDTEKLILSSYSSNRERNVNDKNYANVNMGEGVDNRSSSFVARLSKTIFYIFIFVALVVSGILLATELELIPKFRIEAYEKKLKSLLPLHSLDLLSGEDVKIIDDSGKWITSRYGMVYVVSGKVLNETKHTINYIKLRSRFYSADEKLYEQTFYAGNTLSKKEIEVMSPELIQEKLSRKSGDINFSGEETFVGLNFDIKPGESIPFYTVFHSKSRILGLKYEVQVVGYEKFGI